LHRYRDAVLSSDTLTRGQKKKKKSLNAWVTKTVANHVPAARLSWFCCRPSLHDHVLVFSNIWRRALHISFSIWQHLLCSRLKNPARRSASPNL
jgi:hypothetical protein